ncbi:MAG: hypothetical protein OZSIB_1164 [Candidatus Ozemobacter sibiricus]|jgi:hypothetical protein|uniref:Uncharacterized protein n=1 Tax=Candidatus Ozemobacter sibiricus TaxID=2268124 RepID=A0A367ZLB0_9BACT|nr:MAG: hypothetical protein OZSIB_1164 [Candidatus Ozemobacter sibiricus]
MNVLRLDKTVFEVRSWHDQVSDRPFWLTRTPEERFAAIEFLRQLNYGYVEDPPSLQRVLEVVERSRGQASAAGRRLSGEHP